MIYCALFCTLIVIGRLGYSHAQDGLAIDFMIQTLSNSTYAVNDVSADSTSTDRLHVVCRIASINSILKFSKMNLLRINKNGIVQLLAKMQTEIENVPGYQAPVLEPGTSNMQVVGSYTKTNPTLGVSVPLSGLTCNDEATYRCTLDYGFIQGSDYITAYAKEERNLTVTVKPSSIEMTAFNQSSANFAGMQIQTSGKDSTSPAPFYVGQVIKLTCRASLGSYQNGAIRWKKSNIAAGSSLANHLPNQGDQMLGDVTAVDGCQYQKTDSILYNMTDQDATRAFNNPLQFQCYVVVQTPFFETPEATRQSFFTRVLKETDPTSSSVATTVKENYPTSSGVATTGSGDAGVIAGAVIGSLVGIVIIVLLVYFLWYRRRADGDDCKRHQHSKPVETSPGNTTYETLGDRVLSAEEYVTLGIRVKPAEEYETLGSRVQSAEEYERIGPSSH